MTTKNRGGEEIYVSAVERIEKYIYICQNFFAYLAEDCNYLWKLVVTALNMRYLSVLNCRTM